MKQARLSRTSAPWVIAAVAALAVLSALAGCTMIGDRLTGVQLKADGPTSCIKDCNDFYKGAFDEEQKLHQSNIEACQALDQPAKSDCLDAETSRHEAAKTALSEGKVNCQNGCHRQGNGTAG